MIKKICPVCGKEFEAIRVSRVYCSRSCMNKATYRRSHKKAHKSCVVCGQIFEAIRSDQIYCCKHCQRHARWVRIISKRPESIALTAEEKKERQRGYRRAFYQRHKEEICAKKRERYAKNPEIQKEANLRYIAKNREKYNKYCREYARYKKELKLRQEQALSWEDPLEVAKRKSAERMAKYDAEIAKAREARKGMGYCHDCGKPCVDYRCPTCWQKYRTVYQVVNDGNL